MSFSWVKTTRNFWGNVWIWLSDICVVWTAKILSIFLKNHHHHFKLNISYLYQKSPIKLLHACKMFSLVFPIKTFPLFPSHSNKNLSYLSLNEDSGKMCSYKTTIFNFADLWTAKIFRSLKKKSKFIAILFLKGDTAVRTKHILVSMSIYLIFSLLSNFHTSRRRSLFKNVNLGLTHSTSSSNVRRRWSSRTLFPLRCAVKSHKVILFWIKIASCVTYEN